MAESDEGGELDTVRGIWEGRLKKARGSILNQIPRSHDLSDDRRMSE